MISMLDLILQAADKKSPIDTTCDRTRKRTFWRQSRSNAAGFVILDTEMLIAS
jgi:hypothetical protein